MKQQTILHTLVFLFFVAWGSEAQVLNRVRGAVKNTAENRAVQEAENATNKAIDKALEGDEGNGEENSSGGDASGKETTGESNPANTGNSNDNKSSTAQLPAKASTLKSYANYDFVAGSKIIFQYDMLGETDGELPGRLMLLTGNAEVQTYNGEKVLQVQPGDEVTFKPMMTNDTYLPEQFTLEMDVLYEDPEEQNSFELHVQFPDKDHADLNGWVGQHILSLANINTTNEGYATVIWDQPGRGASNSIASSVTAGRGKWRHIAIYVNKNIGKAYIDEYRIRAVNNLPTGANLIGVSIRDQYNPVLVKNIRLAQGGSDAYNKIVTDGRFIAYGILFDVNKAVLKPESMGTINEISKMLKEHGDLKFEIGGHTDSDGNAANNQKLSQDRADAVKQQLVSMGVDASRLTTKGYGATKPITDNSSAENKARNRRVEFVKK